VKIVSFGPERAVPIEVYSSTGATTVPLGSGEGEAHAWCVRFDAGGSIGEHVAGFGQLFLVVEGSGWVQGADGRRRPIAEGQGAWFARGESHAKGSDAGMTAIMLQVRDLTPADDPDGGGTRGGPRARHA